MKLPFIAFFSLLALVALGFFPAESAWSYESQMSVNLFCRHKVGWVSDDNIYVVSSVVRDDGSYDSSLLWSGRMNRTNRSNVVGIPIWDGQVGPGGALAAVVHVFRRSAPDFQEGLAFGQSFAREAVNSLTRVPEGADAETYLLELQATEIADASFDRFIRDHRDSYLGSFLILVGNSRYNSMPEQLLTPVYRADWPRGSAGNGNRVILKGDGGEYEATVFMSLR